MDLDYYLLKKSKDEEISSIVGSLANAAKKISTIDKSPKCILTSPIHSVKPFLDKNKFNCFAQWQMIDTNYERPFLAIQHVRNLKKSMPYKCKTISETGFRLLFHKKKFITGKLLECT